MSAIPFLFVSLRKRYTDIIELNGELLNFFIKKIEVGECGESHPELAVIGAFAEEAEKIAEQRQRQAA